jgi:cytochrome c oxidase subunit 2
MISEVIVMEDKDFAAWYEGKSVLRDEKEKRGFELLKENGCLACHRTDATEDNGPTFKKLYGKKRYVLENGKEHEVTADEAYLREAILHPGSQVVKGFMNIMPPPEGLSEEDIQNMIDYLRTVQ